MVAKNNVLFELRDGIPGKTARRASFLSFRPAPDRRPEQEPESGRTGLRAGCPHAAGRDAGATPRIRVPMLLT
jgi:hypothetical protein